jgi:hypothetical protein
LTRQNCVPTGYGPSFVVGGLEDLVGRSHVRTLIMVLHVKKRRVMNCVLGVDRSVDICSDRRRAGESWIFIAAL